MTAVGWSFQTVPYWEFTEHEESNCFAVPFAEPLAALQAHVNVTTMATMPEVVYRLEQQGNGMKIEWGAYAKVALLKYAMTIMQNALNGAITEYGKMRFENAILRKLIHALDVRDENAIADVSRVVEMTQSQCEKAYESRWEGRPELPGVPEWKAASLTLAALHSGVNPAVLIHDVVGLMTQTFKLKDQGRDSVNDGLKTLLLNLRKNSESDGLSRPKNGQLLLAYYGTGNHKPWQPK